MTDGVRCFLLTPSGRVSVALRRYAGALRCGDRGYHDASAVISEAPDDGRRRLPDDDEIPHDDPRWPTHCGCGYAFATADSWQHVREPIYERSDGGPPVTLRDAGVGAMWYAPWLSGGEFSGPDGMTVVVRCPGRHDWIIDGRASNCDSPCARCQRPYRDHVGGLCDSGRGYVADGSNSYRDARPHKCWIRHGEPPKITVDKAGVTCGAGAGSISYPGWHGFLRRGRLVAC